jgi:hypothetical protein
VKNDMKSGGAPSIVKFCQSDALRRTGDPR